MSDERNQTLSKDFILVRDKLFFHLVNVKNSEELLADAPHIVINDMAVVFYLVDYDESQLKLAVVRNDLWKHWQVSEEVLFNHAQYNAPMLLGARITGMSDMAKEILVSQMDAPGKDTLLKVIADGEAVLPHYTATNVLKFYGAGVILYRGFLQQFANQLQSDLLIIPISVHCVLLVAANQCRNVNGLKMVKDILNEVNSDGIAPEDVLSDDLYYYQRGVDGLSVLAL